jgi:integrase
MPRPRPPNLHRETTRHGKTIWYVRVDRGRRIRIRSEFGSPVFDAEYRAALDGKSVSDRKGGPALGSLAWLFDRYRETSAWAKLSLATRRQRENIMRGVLKTGGTTPCSQITRANIVAGRDRRAETPAQARNFLDAVRGLFRWALEAGHVKTDPTQGVANPSRPKGGGFPVWTESDVARYEARWPIGTKERVWLAVLLYTGLRRGDAVRLGPEHMQDGVATLQTEKSGGMVTVTIPILPVLADILQAGPVGPHTFICGARGVRKIGATRAAENGATVAELEAIFGWYGGGMASLYTRSADRVRLAKGAISKLSRSDSIPLPIPAVRESAEKDQ